MGTAAVKFTGAVFEVHVFIDGRETGLSQHGNDWEGSAPCGDGQIQIRMRFIAMTGTDWGLVVKRGGKKILDESGTSQTQIVEKVWPADDTTSKLIHDSEKDGPTPSALRLLAAQMKPRKKSKVKTKGAASARKPGKSNRARKPSIKKAQTRARKRAGKPPRGGRRQ